ncbi:MAG: imidazole glycerol phosphate synthase subunit HisH [Candidatus Heimdallarchaeota archaeon]
MIGVIDYNAGNQKNVCLAFNRLGERVQLVSQVSDLDSIERLVFPGVGAFGSVLAYLNETGLYSAIKEWILEDKSFLGICLGLQVLFEISEETPGVKGLGIIKGDVSRFTEGKIPQIGWNKVKSRSSQIDDEFYYFANSYYVQPKEEEIIVATTEYFREFCSAVSFGNILAMQFHPERSGKAGMELLKRWVS